MLRCPQIVPANAMISQCVIEPQTGAGKQRKGRLVGFHETQFVIITHIILLYIVLHYYTFVALLYICATTKFR